MVSMKTIVSIGAVIILAVAGLTSVVIFTDDTKGDDSRNYTVYVGVDIGVSCNYDTIGWEPLYVEGSVPGLTCTLDYVPEPDVGLVNFSGTPTTPGNYTVRVHDGYWSVYFYFTVIGNYTHTITYNGNGATGGSVGNTVVTDSNGGNTNVTLASNGFSRPGYMFAGWSVGGVTYQPGQAIPVGANATATAYAVWSQNTVSGTAINLAGLSGHSYTNQISAVASNNATFTFAVKSCSAGTASVNSSGLVTFNAPSVSATTSCNVVITVTAHYPDGQTKTADVAFTVSVDPVLVFTNSVTNGTLSIKGA